MGPWGSDVGQGPADAGNVEVDGAGAAHEGDGLFDLRAVLDGHLVEVGADAVDEPVDPADLLLRGHGPGTGPLFGFERGHQPFPAAQQVGEVGPEVGEAGHVGGEVLAAQAPEPEWARVPTRRDVRGFAAHPVRSGAFPDRAAYVLGVQQTLAPRSAASVRVTLAEGSVTQAPP